MNSNTDSPPGVRQPTSTANRKIELLLRTQLGQRKLYYYLPPHSRCLILIHSVVLLKMALNYAPSIVIFEKMAVKLHRLLGRADVISRLSQRSRINSGGGSLSLDFRSGGGGLQDFDNLMMILHLQTSRGWISIFKNRNSLVNVPKISLIEL